MRYGELRKDILHITDKMLTSQLRQLEAEGFIHRKVYAVVLPKVPTIFKITNYDTTSPNQARIKR